MEYKLWLAPDSKYIGTEIFYKIIYIVTIEIDKTGD